MTSIILVFSAFSVHAQTSPVSWTVELSANDENTFSLKLHSSLDPGWYIYSQYLESDEGPVATSITIEEHLGFELLGIPTEIGNKKEAYDELFEMTVSKFGEEVVFEQKFQRIDDASKKIKGYITYMICDEERCLPPTDFEFEASL